MLARVFGAYNWGVRYLACPGKIGVLNWGCNQYGINNTSRQLKYVKTIIDQTTSSSTSAIYYNNPTTPEPPPSSIRDEPIYFIADTDSISYVMNTGANCVILNNCSLVNNLKTTCAKIKGIGGNTIQISGTGDRSLGLKSDDGNYDVITGLPVVLVPSCPCNLIPPQLLIKHIKSLGYIINELSHTDSLYTLKYQSPSNSSNRIRTISIPIAPNGLFILRSKDGYTPFMSRASTYFKEFKKFAGASHVIPDDDDNDSVPTCKPCYQSPDKTREYPPA